MALTTNETRKLLRDSMLKATAPRLAVVRVLEQAQQPLSYSEVLEELGQCDWDPATIYRNLVKLRDVGIASVVSRAEGIDRYTLTPHQRNDHKHAHFICMDCGRMLCLPTDLTASLSANDPWTQSIQRAMIELRGECPDCLK